MKFRNKGRKIYKTKEKNYYGKSPADRILSTCLTLLLVGGIGVVGYSAAGPILNFTRKQGDDPQNDLPFTIDSSGFKGGDGTSSEDIFQPEEPASEDTAETSEAPDVKAEEYSAVALTVNDVMTVESLKNALAAIPSEEHIRYVEIPLKITGGEVCFNSTNEEAWRSGAVKSMIMLPEYAETIKEAGFRPAGLLSTYSDNIMPASYPLAGYMTADGKDQWIDDSYEAGGKPWLSPYSELSVNYLSYLCGEAVDAGFDYVVCSDFTFPVFRETDLSLLDERLSRKDRFTAMTSVANSLYTKCLEGGVKMFVEVSASDLLSGKGEVLQPMMLSTGTVVLNIDIDHLAAGISDGKTIYEFTGTPAEITEKALGFLADRFKDFNTVIRISGTGISTEELLKARDIARDKGYNSYVIG